MKTIPLVLLIYIQTGLVFGQRIGENPTLTLSCDENEIWLSQLTQLDKPDQWSMITNRFFKFQPQTDQHDSTQICLPVLVIGGIPLMITNDLSEQSREDLSSLLTLDKIDKIGVLDKEPDGLYINKAFTGWIIVTLRDRRTYKRLERIPFD